MEFTTFTTYMFPIPIILALYLLKSHFTRSQNGPPSPATRLPLIGHFHTLKEPFHKTLANLATQHGPILSLWLGSRPVLLISSPSAAEECLAKNDIVFCNRPSGFLTVKHLAYDYNSLIWAPYGPHWRNLRRMSTIEILSSHRLTLHPGIRSNEVKLMIQQLYNEVCGPSSSKVVTMKPLMYEVSMNVMSRMIFGKRYYGVEGEEPKRFREMLCELLRLFNDACIGDMMIPCLRWLDWPKGRRLRKFKEERAVVLTELMAEHRVAMKVEDGGGESNKVVKPLVQV